MDLGSIKCRKGRIVVDERERERESKRRVREE
jgi:hypothetical protein